MFTDWGILLVFNTSDLVGVGPGVGSTYSAFQLTVPSQSPLAVILTPIVVDPDVAGVAVIVMLLFKPGFSENNLLLSV